MVLTASEYINSTIEKKERKLIDTNQLADRIVLLKDLVHHYSFVNIKKAEHYLIHYRELAEALNNNEHLAFYHMYTAFLENQQYRYHFAITHFKTAAQLFEDEGLTHNVNDLFLDLAATYSNMNMIAESEFYIDTADRWIEKQGDTILKSRSLYRRANSYLRRFVYDKSIEVLMDSKNLLENYTEGYLDIKDYHNLAQIYGSLGFIYNKVEKINEGVDAYLQAIEISEKFGFVTRLSWYYLHIGNSFSSLRKYKQAGIYFRKAITGTPHDLSTHSKASASANLGHIYFRRGNYDSALSMYGYAEKLFKENKGLDDNYNFSVLELYRAQLHLDLGNEAKAMEHYEQAIQFALKSEDYKQMATIYKDLADLYERKEDYKMAYQYQKEYLETRDKFLDEEKNRAFTELEVKYETEKKERETELLRLQTTELQLKALRAQMNPHFIFNALNSIQAYITGGNPEQATLYFSKFSRLIRNSLEYSEFDVIPLEDEVQFLEDYLELEKERFKGDFDFNISIDAEVEEDIMGIPPMIIQPYLENAIKHGIRDVKNGFIKLSFEMEEDETLLCVVEDNGIGRKKAVLRQKDYQNESHRSMGTLITQQRLDIINQNNIDKGLSTLVIDLKDDNQQPKGTRVEIRLPILAIDNKFYT